MLNSGACLPSSDYRFSYHFYQKFIELNLGERTSLTVTEVANHSLDPERLYLAVDANVRVYFVHEGAGYRNTLGFNTESGGANSGNPKIIFPDVSCPSDSIRKTMEPLSPGDYVDLGTFAAGTQLRFFLIADGARGGRNVFSTEQSLNQDGLQHVVAFIGDETSYMLLGFEDLWGGGDRDYNDCLFAVDIGEQNVKALRETVSAPVEELLAQLVDRLMGKLSLLESGTVAYGGLASRNGQKPDFAMQIDQMVREKILEMDGMDMFSSDVLLQTLKQVHATEGDLIDTSLVLRIGETLSVDYFITGMIIPAGESIIVFGRIVNVDKGTIEVSTQIVLNSLSLGEAGFGN